MESNNLRQQNDELRKELEMLYAFDDLRDTHREPRPLMKAALDLCGKELQVERSWLWYYDDIVEDYQLFTSEPPGYPDLSGHREKIRVVCFDILNRKDGEIEVVKPDMDDVREMAVVPLVLNEQALGVIAFINKTEGEDFTSLDHRLMTALSSQLDSAIEASNQYMQAQVRSRELELVYQIDEIRDTSGSFDELLQRLLHALVETMDSKFSFINVFDEKAQNLELKLDGTFSSEDERNLIFDVINDFSQRAINEARLMNLTAIHPAVESFIAKPLFMQDRLIGVFGAVNSHSGTFTQTDERLLSAVASQVDTAIFENLEKRKIKDVFKRYVSEEVIEEMLANEGDYLKGKTLDMSVLFADMRGFTALSETLNPEDLVEIINEYLSTMTKIILDERGTVDKFVGDEVMALFGAPFPNPKHAHQAVRTAIAMMKGMKELLARWKIDDKPGRPIGIGINSGNMIVGNIGSELMTDYTVMGDNVNLGARLCSAAEEHQILIPETTWEQVKNDFDCNPLSAIEVKGKSQPIQIYEVRY
jgi:class 3 adenylate cyclase